MNQDSNQISENQRQSVAKKGGRGGKRPGDGLNLPLASGEWDSIRDAAQKLSGSQYGNLPAAAFQPQNEKIPPEINQKPYSNPKSQSDTATKNH